MKTKFCKAQRYVVI